MWKTPFRPVPSTTFFPQALCKFFYFSTAPIFLPVDFRFSTGCLSTFHRACGIFLGCERPRDSTQNFSGAAKALTRYSYFGTLPPSEGGKRLCHAVTAFRPSSVRPDGRPPSPRGRHSYTYIIMNPGFCKAIFEKRAADFTISNPFVHLIL